VRRKAFLIGLLVAAGLSAASATELVFFYDPGCPHCSRVEAFLQGIAPDYPELEVRRYNIRESGSQELLDKLLSAYGVELGPVPLIFVGDVALIGDTFYGLREEAVELPGRAGELALEEAVQRAIAARAPSPLTRIQEVEGAGLAERLTLPAVLIAAAVDSVNPCCFAILIFLFGTLLTASVVSIPGAFAIGVLDSLFLLPCSSGPYIAILALLSQTTTRGTGILYLLLYNLVFIVPLVGLTLGVHLGFTTTARAERWRSARLGKLHLVSGAVMLLLGVGMIVALQLGHI
jgi:glutaredoxin